MPASSFRLCISIFSSAFSRGPPSKQPISPEKACRLHSGENQAGATGLRKRRENRNFRTAVPFKAETPRH